jgi:hypothetical protein
MNIHASGGIRTRNPSKRTAADLCLRPRGHDNAYTSINILTLQRNAKPESSGFTQNMKYAFRNVGKFLRNCSRSHRKLRQLLQSSPCERHTTDRGNLISAFNYISALTALPTIRTGRWMDCQTDTPPKQDTRRTTRQVSILINFGDFGKHKMAEDRLKLLVTALRE